MPVYGIAKRAQVKAATLLRARGSASGVPGMVWRGIADQSERAIWGRRLTGRPCPSVACRSKIICAGYHSEYQGHFDHRGPSE